MLYYDSKGQLLYMVTVNVCVEIVNVCIVTVKVYIMTVKVYIMTVNGKYCVL
jgi:hypothetical protein